MSWKQNKILDNNLQNLYIQELRVTILVKKKYDKAENIKNFFFCFCFFKYFSLFFAPHISFFLIFQVFFLTNGSSDKKLFLSGLRYSDDCWAGRCLTDRIMRPRYQHLNFQKSQNFLQFWATFGTFFFKISFWSNTGKISQKMVLLRFFSSWRWFLLIFEQFLIN